MTRLFISVLVLLMFSDIQSRGQGVCPENGYPAGLTIPDPQHARPFNVLTLPVDRNSFFIMTTKGAVNCYGVIRAWRFGRQTGICDDVKFMVWRETTGQGYRLVGQNTYDTCTSPPTGFGGDVFTHLVPEEQQIAVEPGDLLGWQLLNGGGTDGMLQYEDDTIISCACGEIKRFDTTGSCNPGIQPGDYCNETPTPLTRDYSIQAIVYSALLPSIDNLDRHVVLYEDKTAIFTVTASHPSNEVDLVYAMDDIVLLTYSLDPSERLFSIDSTTGDITGTLDYETDQHHTVTVWVTGHLRTDQAVLTVEVLDKNEKHSLVPFNPNPVYVSAQTTQAGDQIFQLEVTDPDTINPSVISFYLSTAVPFDHLPFEVEKQTGVIRSMKDLHDWIYNTSYELQVHAADHMYKDGPKTLDVNIVDTIDLPELYNMDASVDVSENVLPNSKIFQALVRAPYPDEVVFYITQIRPWQEHDFFTIDSQTGEVVVTEEADMDFLEVNTYYVEIKARDHLQKSLPKNLTVNVTWGNQPPLFTSPSYTVLIPEKTNGPFLDIVVEDRDVDNNLPNPPLTPDTVHCSIIKGSHYFFEIDPTCTSLQVIHVIDVNTFPELMTLNLTIHVHDQKAEDNGTALVRINVFDINDHRPEFAPDTYVDSIEENTPGGVSILTVTATDKDMGINAEITYSLNDQSNIATSYFQIDPVTGVLSTKQPIDYEEYEPSVTFQVVATDGGTPSLSGTATVIIDIIDLNDNRPEFQCLNKEDDHYYHPSEQCFYNLEVRSDVFINHTIMSLTATDVDSVTPNPRFFLLKPEEHIGLHPASGNVTVDEELYNKHKYVLHAYARDQGEPELLSTPSILRIDTFPKCTYMVDITLAITDEEFVPKQKEFIDKLRNITYPWVVKIEPQGNYVDKTLATIYALRDSSTFLFGNLHTEKIFVGRYELMRKLRRNIYGGPNHILGGPEFEDFHPTEVMPHCVIWWIDTVPGLATTSTLIFLFLLIWVILAICLCRRFKKLCFKDKPPPKSWPKEMKSVQEPSTKRPRRGSVDTVHSLIYDFQYENKQRGAFK